MTLLQNAQVNILFYLFFRWTLQFVKSEFSGQLPKYYSQGIDATSVIPDFMNDENKEEMTRYVCNIFFQLRVIAHQVKHLS